jgi:hypothetical protein
VPEPRLKPIAVVAVAIAAMLATFLMFANWVAMGLTSTESRPLRRLARPVLVTKPDSAGFNPIGKKVFAASVNGDWI